MKKNSTDNVPASDVRYVVAWGGDKRSQDALKLGSVLARTFGAQLSIVYVVQTATAFTLSAGDSRSFEEEVGKEAAGWLKKAAKSVGKGVDVTTHVYYDTSVTNGILRAVDELGANLVVIGAGSGKGREWVVHPTAAGLLHASPVPVAMAPLKYRNVKFDELTSLSAAIGPREGAQLVIDESVEAVTRSALPLNLISLVAMDSDKSIHIDRFDEAEKALKRAAEKVGGRAQVTTKIGKGRNLRSAVRKMDWDERTVLLVGSSRLARNRTTFLGSSATRMLSALPVPMIVVPRGEGQ